MKSALSSEKQRRCPVCGEGDLVARRITEKFEHGPDDDRVTVEARDVPVEVCNGCGESCSGPESARVRHEAVCKAHGLLSPNEIKAIREQRDMSQSQFANLTGISEPSLSRWERGRLLQSKALDRYLRLLASNAENIRLLEKIASERDDRAGGSESAAAAENREAHSERGEIQSECEAGKMLSWYWCLATLISASFQQSKPLVSNSEITEALGLRRRGIEPKSSQQLVTLSFDDLVVQELAARLERKGTKLRVMIPSKSPKSSRRFVLDVAPGDVSENKLAEHALQFEESLSDVPDPQRDEVVSKIVGIVDLLK